MSLKNDGSGTQFSIQTAYTEAVDDFTAQAFMYMGASNSTRVLDKFNGAGTSGYGIYRNGNGTSVRGNASHLTPSPNSATAIGVCNQGQWYHLVCRRIIGTVDFFVDNVAVTPAVGTAGVVSTDPLYIGNSAAGLNGWVGNIFKVACWNVGLSNGEIAGLFNKWSPRKIRPGSLKVYRPLLSDSNPMWVGDSLAAGVGTWVRDSVLQPSSLGIY